MSGHSKWSKIKRQKGLNDQAKGKIFSKMSRLISISVSEGGGVVSPENNLRLRMAIEKARQINMPRESIERAIEKGVGPDKSLMKSFIYEAFARYGVGLLIVGTTDNSNRSIAEIKNALDKGEGRLGNQGSVMHLFKHCAYCIFDLKKATEEDVLNFSAKIAAFDIDEDEESFIVYFPFENLGKIKEIAGTLSYEMAEEFYKPLSEIIVNEEKKHLRVISLINDLEDLDDVHNVYSNLS